MDDSRRMLMILCAEDRVDDLVALLDRHQVEGYTELTGLQGAGATGRHFGTRAYPGTVSMLLTVGSEQAVAALSVDLKAMAARCRPGEGLRAFAFHADSVV